jgi:hypothetical protein
MTLTWLPAELTEAAPSSPPPSVPGGTTVTMFPVVGRRPEAAERPVRGEPGVVGLVPQLEVGDARVRDASTSLTWFCTTVGQVDQLN